MTINRTIFDPNKIEFAKMAKLYSEAKGSPDSGLFLPSLSQVDIRDALVEVQVATLSALLPRDLRPEISQFVRNPILDLYALWCRALIGLVDVKPNKISSAIEDLSRKALDFEGALRELGRNSGQAAVQASLSSIDPATLRDRVSQEIGKSGSLVLFTPVLSGYFFSRFNVLKSIGEELSFLARQGISAPLTVSRAYENASAVGGFYGMMIFGIVYSRRIEFHTKATGSVGGEDASGSGSWRFPSCSAIEAAVADSKSISSVLGGYSDRYSLELFMWQTKRCPGEEVRVAKQIGEFLGQLKAYNVTSQVVVRFLESVTEVEGGPLLEACCSHPELVVPFRAIKLQHLDFAKYRDFIFEYIEDSKRYDGLWGAVTRWIGTPKMVAPAALLINNAEALSLDPNFSRVCEIAERCKNPGDFLRHYTAAVSEGRSDRQELLCRLYEAKLSDTKLYSLLATVTRSLDQESGEVLVASLSPRDSTLVAKIEDYARDLERKRQQQSTVVSAKSRGIPWQEEILSDLLKDGATQEQVADVQFLLDNIPHNLRTLPKRFRTLTPDSLIPLAQDFRKLHTTQTFILLLNNEEYSTRYREQIRKDKHGSFSQALANLCLSAHVASHEGLRDLLCR